MYQFSANSIGAGIFDKRSKIIGRFRDRHLKNKKLNYFGPPSIVIRDNKK